MPTPYSPLDPRPDWLEAEEARQAAIRQRQEEEARHTSRAQHLQRATIALLRAADCDRIGPVKLGLIDDAASHLAWTGEDALAARLVNGTVNVAAALDMLERMPR